MAQYICLNGIALGIWCGADTIVQVFDSLNKDTDVASSSPLSSSPDQMGIPCDCFMRVSFEGH